MGARSQACFVARTSAPEIDFVLAGRAAETATAAEHR